MSGSDSTEKRLYKWKDCLRGPAARAVWNRARRGALQHLKPYAERIYLERATGLAWKVGPFGKWALAFKPVIRVGREP